MGGSVADGVVESRQSFSGPCKEYNTAHGCIEAVNGVEVYLTGLLFIDLDPCLCLCFEAVSVCAAGLREQVRGLVQRKEVVIAV